MNERETRRWTGVTAFSLAAGAAGIFASRPTALLVGVVAVGYAAFASAASSPEPTVSVERTLGQEEAAPGAEVRVSLTVRNEGSSPLTDLRAIDGVPGGLSVVSGTPRLATALRPGKRATLTYVVEAERGEHAFDPVQVIARDASGAIEVETDVDDNTVLTCLPRLRELDEFPLRSQGGRHAGRVTLDSGGTGTEFHSIREYHHGDPISRIDWNHRAKTGELATVRFHQERAATVVLLIDARVQSYVGDDRPALDHAVSAAAQVAGTLLSTNDRVGMAALGPYQAWVPPGTGRNHRRRLRETLGTARAFSPTPPEDGRFNPVENLATIRKRLSEEAQIVFFSPLTDTYGPTLPRRLAASGYPVTVVSPDVTDASNAGERLAAVERANRIHDLRQVDVRVIDWDPDRSFATAVVEAARRWRG